jgi:predicted nucleotidyltransferase
MGKKSVVKIVKDYAKLVDAKYKFNQLYLFGSYAKGNYNADSDIDVAIIFDDFDNRIIRQADLLKLGRKIDSRIEPHPFRKSEFNNSSIIVSEILKTGKYLTI